MHNTQIQILPGGDVSAREQEVQGLQEWDLQRPGLSQEQRQSCSSDCWESVIMIIQIMVTNMMIFMMVIMMIMITIMTIFMMIMMISIYLKVEVQHKVQEDKMDREKLMGKKLGSGKWEI